MSQKHTISNYVQIITDYEHIIINYLDASKPPYEEIASFWNTIIFEEEMFREVGFDYHNLTLRSL